MVSFLSMIKLYKNYSNFNKMKLFCTFYIFFLFQLSGYVANAQQMPSTVAYFVTDGSCCGGEESDPHAVFGIESSDGYILIGKSLDETGNENGFALKMSKGLPNKKLFLHPDENKSYEWSIVLGKPDRRDGFNSAAIIENDIIIAGFEESKEGVIDRHLVKVRLNDGKVLWKQSYSSEKKKASSSFESVIVTSAGGILLTGVKNASYDEIEGFKSYGNPSGGNAFSMYFSHNKISSETPPKSPTWESVYDSFISGKSVKEISDTGNFIIATSTPEPMIAAVLRINKNGNILWDRKYPKHGEITDIAVSNDGFFLSGHKGDWENGYDGSITKISYTGKILWNKTIGNPIGGENKFSGLDEGNRKLIFDECWGIATIGDSDVVVACGTGIEGCDELKNHTKSM